MGSMRSYQISDFGGNISEVIQDIPEPIGTEVLLKVTHAGVCHSDLHIAEGYYDLGGGTRLTLGDRGIKLPHTMGHEVLGKVAKAGGQASETPVGAVRLVHPWIGRMECSECQRGRENHCMKPQSLGVFRPGGYAEYILVPHPTFLVEVDGINPAVATPYACSGVTVYSALKKALPISDDEWLAIMGCGGLGLGAVAIAKAMGVKNVVSCDIDDMKLQAATDTGASAIVKVSADDAHLRKGVRSLGASGATGCAVPRHRRRAPHRRPPPHSAPLSGAVAGAYHPCGGRPRRAYPPTGALANGGASGRGQIRCPGAEKRLSSVRWGSTPRGAFQRL